MENNLISGRDIIVVGQQAWDTDIGSNCKNLAIEFSKHNRVLYVNSPLDTKTKYKNKLDPKIQKRVAVINKERDGLEEVSDSMWTYYPDTTIHSINWINSNAIFNFFNRINNKRFAVSIKKAINKLQFKDFILFNDSDIFRSFYLKELLSPSVSIYYSRDYMLATDYWKKHGVDLEPKLIAKSDLCTANSPYLADYCAQYNPRSFYVGQGCDLSLFSSADGFAIPTDIKPIKRPVIGYVGVLQSIRLDMGLLRSLAEQRPDWSIVLVGPQDEEFTVSDLHEIKNIYFLGAKDGNMLPAYINSFDICINPQVVNQVTIGNYPRKIDEYLAMGKPTVATSTRAMEIFEDYTYLGKTKEDYLTLIQKALDENTTELQNQRKSFAASHTWENNALEIYKAINSLNK
jgi:glycosyltransferase involved in cell wall biosynthesis